jgi:hypothetical protein
METKEKRQTNREYLSMIADRISSERPVKEIILNTLIDIEERGYGRGYRARIADGAKFRDAQTKRREESWNSVKDNIDDKVHSVQPEVINQQDK